ncbi:MAG: aspartate 1-decarboxylase [archaeon]|nr:aspartate 1-decarboxylase [archaeon]
MKRFMCKSKIHRATVTGKNIDYEGSISIPKELLAAADILPYEKVHVWNVTNGKRFETYAIKGKKGEIRVNGSAAHLCDIGDLVIIASFGLYGEQELANFRQKVILVGGDNCIRG